MTPLEATGLQTFYGKSHILHNVGLTVNEGEIVVLLGRNGAGKTTTLRSVMALTPPREGSVRIFGTEASHLSTYQVASLGVGYVPEGRKIFANLTVEDNLRVPMQRPGPWTIKRVFETFPRLAPLLVKEVFQIIQAMRKEGIAVLLVEQNVRVSLGIADRAYVLDDGAVVYSGTAEALAGDEERVRSMAGASEKEWSADGKPGSAPKDAILGS